MSSPNSPAEDLREDFCITTLNSAKWTATTSGGGTVAVSDGSLVLGTDGVNTSVTQVYSAQLYDLTSSQFSFQVGAFGDAIGVAALTMGGPEPWVAGFYAGTDHRAFTFYHGT